MTVEQLRRKARDRTPVLWPRMGAIGLVSRVARDGSWADMEWGHSYWDLFAIGPGPTATWRKRQPLDCIAEWEHG